MTSVNILSVDLSYRDTGICCITNKHGQPEVIQAYSFKNDKTCYGFECMRAMMEGIAKTINEIRLKAESFKADVTLIEVPYFSQSARSAMVVGLCWGAVAELDCILVEPSFLKVWSDSERGDKKSEVKLKVMSMTCLDKKQLANDNIIDAVGLGLAFCELMNQ